MYICRTDKEAAIINTIEDFRDFISDDLYETLEELTSGNRDELEKQVKILENEIKGYDADVCGLRSGMTEALELLEKILDGNRINRKDIESVKKILENSEGY